MTELGSLITVRRENTPSPEPAERLRRATRRLEAGQAEVALAEVLRMPGREHGRDWIMRARRYVERPAGAGCDRDGGAGGAEAGAGAGGAACAGRSGARSAGSCGTEQSGALIRRGKAAPSVLAKSEAGRARRKAACFSFAKSARGALERAKGFEPSTPTLARLCSTPELRPLSA